MKYTIPNEGDLRTIRKFAFLPIKEAVSISITSVRYEKRWLCFVKLQQMFSHGKWRNVCFLHNN